MLGDYKVKYDEISKKLETKTNKAENLLVKLENKVDKEEHEGAE